MSFKDAFQSQEAEEGGGFALIEQGEYDAEITDIKLDLNKEPNRLTIQVTLIGEPYSGRKGWLNYQLEGRGIGFLKKDLTTLGLSYDEIGSPEDIVDLLNNVLNQPVVVFVNQKEWQGKTYNNFYLNALSDPPAALDKTIKPGPTNQKEAERQAAKSMTTKTPPKNAAPQKTAAKPAKGKPATKPGAEPNFDESNEVPW